MNKIHFITKNNNEFTSRWKDILVPENKIRGKQNARLLSGMDKGNYKMDDLDFITRPDLIKDKFKKLIPIAQDINKQRTTNAYRARMKIGIPLYPRKPKPDLQERLLTYKKKKVALTTTNNQKSFRLRWWTPDSSPSPIKLTPKRMGMKVTGGLALGAIGLGIVRKIRSDKNKKRGSYRR